MTLQDILNHNDGITIDMLKKAREDLDKPVVTRGKIDLPELRAEYHRLNELKRRDKLSNSNLKLLDEIRYVLNHIDKY